MPFNSQASFGELVLSSYASRPLPELMSPHPMVTVSGEQLQSAIANMVDMGFEREQVMKALRASFNNPDRAVEYLMSVRTSSLDACCPSTQSS